MLFLYINLCLNVFGQEPSLDGDTVDSKQVLQTEELQKKELQKKELPKNIEGLSPQDNTMIQLMLKSEQKISHEQRLLGGNSETAITDGNQDTKMQFVDMSGLYNYIIVLVCLVLFLLGIVTFFSRKKTSNIPQMRMVARSMYGNEGSLAIVALENDTSKNARYILLGLNQGAAPRLIMELDSYIESSSTNRSNQKQVKSSHKKTQNFESQSNFDSKTDDLRDVLSRANFSDGKGIPKMEALHTVVDNDISFDEEEFLLQDHNIVKDASKPQTSHKTSTTNNASDEEKWLKELQNAMGGNISDRD